MEEETVKLVRRDRKGLNGFYFTFGIGKGINYFCDNPLIYWPDGKTEPIVGFKAKDYVSGQTVLSLPRPYPGVEPDFTSGKVFYVNTRKSSSKEFPHIKIDLYIPAALFNFEERCDRNQTGYKIDDTVNLVSGNNPRFIKQLRVQSYEDEELKTEALNCLATLVEHESKAVDAALRLKELDPDYEMIQDHKASVLRVSGKPYKSFFPQNLYIYQ
jgi:hypothetical protein